ncbi:Uncharacterised protein [uncultured archaeon]|nr:Uncharacterised protein [uncultured archaeon]
MARKNPYIAALLSFFISGLGQFYVGDVMKGLVFIIFEFMTAFILVNVNYTAGGILNLFVGVWSIFDAYRSAQRKNLNEAPKTQVHPTAPKLKVY